MLGRLLGRRDERIDDGRRGAPDVTRVGDLSPEELEALVKRRRTRRRLQALGAAGLAVAPGLFLSCAGRQPEPAPAPPRTPDAGSRDAGADAGVPPEADAGTRAAQETRDAAIDVQQHRDGMPVPDNLLE